MKKVDFILTILICLFCVLLSTTMSLVKAEDPIDVSITLNASFESQNVMKKSYRYDENNEMVFHEYWNYVEQIKNFYINNEIEEINEYAYKFDVSEEDNGRVVAYLVTNQGDSNYYDLYLQADGIIYPNTDSSYYFMDMINLEYLDNLSGIDTSNVTDMSWMFAYAGYSSEIFTLDVRNFDTSNVTDMSWMFGYIGYNNPNFTLDVSSFDTRNVIDMGDMFRYAGHNSENFTLDVSNFDTSKVTDMSYMFADTGYNSTIFNIDLSGFDTSNVTNMEAMFYNTGINSTELDTSITIKNPNTIYGLMFVNSVSKEGSKIRVNYTKDTEELVAKMIATKSSNSNVVKGNLIVDVDNLAIGDEIHISGEKFNIISQTDDTITMLAQYNLGPDYKQSTTNNYLKFADSKGWEYTPGPKEIDIQEWSTNPKTYINEYVTYLQGETGDTALGGNLITLIELKELGCTINDNYADTSNYNCYHSSYNSWLLNDQDWWTRSADSSHFDSVWHVLCVGDVISNYYFNGSSNFYYFLCGIRPTITISKEALRNFG